MDATLKTELATASPTTFTAVSIALPGGTIRLVSGGAVVIGGNAYSAYSSTYGSLSMVNTIGDGADGSVSRATITLLPAGGTAIADLTDTDAQGSVVVIYQGAINEATGAAIGTSETLFTGELDYCRLSVGPGGWSLEIECGTEEGRLLEPNEEWVLSDAFHKAIWPGELGLENVSAVQRKVYWRSSDPGAIRTGGGTRATGRIGADRV